MGNFLSSIYFTARELEAYEIRAELCRMRTENIKYVETSLYVDLCRTYVREFSDCALSLTAKGSRVRDFGIDWYWYDWIKSFSLEDYELLEAAYVIDFNLRSYENRRRKVLKVLARLGAKEMLAKLRLSTTDREYAHAQWEILQNNPDIPTLSQSVVGIQNVYDEMRYLLKVGGREPKDYDEMERLANLALDKYADGYIQFQLDTRYISLKHSFEIIDEGGFNKGSESFVATVKLLDALIGWKSSRHHILLISELKKRGNSNMLIRLSKYIKAAE